MDDDIATSAEALENAALPRCREVHADPQVATPQAARSAQNKSPAQWAYERLILYIQNFEESLDAEHEVAMGFAGDSSGTIRIAGLGFYDPDIITFYGTDSHGTKTQLVQHVTQLSVMLRALPKPDAQQKARRIGFRLAQSLDDDEEVPEEATPPKDKATT